MSSTSDQSRRSFLTRVGTVGAGLLSAPAIAEKVANLAFANGRRQLASNFPQKGEMILQRTRPPLLETPMDVFDKGIFTPNDRFFVRWHWADIPTSIDVDSFRLKVYGNVDRPLAIPLSDILRMPRIEVAAVNQCSGNSRGLFSPRVPGGEWGHGAMGNAQWLGVRLRDVLDRAGVKPGSLAVRFSGLDQPVVDGAPDFAKSLSLDHARDGEVMIAFAMNGEQMPLLNGFPLRLVVPGWYSTYWVKMLSEIEVLSQPDKGYWMAKAYKIPDTPFASVTPVQKDYPTVPINRMIPRAWITSLGEKSSVAFMPQLPIGGIAMGGDTGVAKVDLSIDAGRTWASAQLGPDAGKYSFRRFDGVVRPTAKGQLTVMARCTNSAGQTQPMIANWNASGFMRGVVESTRVMLG